MHAMERSSFSRTHQPGARREADMRKSGEKPRVYNYFVQQLQQMAAIEFKREEEASRRSASAAAASPSNDNSMDVTITQQNDKVNSSVNANINGHPTSTSTPKRRRKEDGNDFRVRFSPEKRLVDPMSLASPAASLLDDDDDDELSQLVGTSIPQPPSAEWKKSRLLPEVNPFDELSYSDSEVEESTCGNNNNNYDHNYNTDPPAVARNLSKELMWESLEDEEEDDIDIDGGCKIKQPKEKVVVFEGPLLVTTSLRKKSHGKISATSPNDNTRSPRNRVMTAEPGAGTGSRRKKKRRPPPLDRVLGRQVSVCSELTMEGLPSEESSSSITKHSGGTFSSDECELASISSDTRDDSQWYDSSDGGTSTESVPDSVDTGVMSNIEPYALRRDSPRRHHRPPGENHMNKPGRLWMYDNRQQSSTCRRSLHPISQQQQHHHHKQPHRSRSSKKRKGGHHTNNHRVSWADHTSSSNSRQSSNLFPLSHLTDSFKSKSTDENDSLERSGSGSKHRNGTETSLLMDLSHELQEMVVIAGKSGEELVASLFHQLCEE